MSELGFRQFASRQALDEGLAEDVSKRLSTAVARRGRAVLALSGGTTPEGFLRLLAGKALPWEHLVVTLVDERWVPAAGHADSNERLLRECLLADGASAARFLSLRGAAESPGAAARVCERAWSALGTFDVVVLGMGADGHTASLFPGAAALGLALDIASGRACVVVYPPTARYPRLTMTLPRILAARAIFVHITGAEKRAVLDRALQAQPDQIPVAAVLQQELTPVTVYWAP